MNNKILLGSFVVLVAVAIAYWIYAGSAPVTDTSQYMGGTNSGENAEPGSIHNLPVEPAAAAAREDLAAKIGVSEGAIVIMRVENKTWSDGCFGLGGPAESCLAALVDGFRVELEAQGKTYVYRTDATGAAVRAE